MSTVGVYCHVVEVAPGEATVASIATNAAWNVPSGRIHCPVAMLRIDTWTWPTPTLSVAPPVKVGVRSFSTALFAGNVIVPSAGWVSAGVVFTEKFRVARVASTLLAASVAPTLARYEPSGRVTDSDQLADVAPGLSR